MIVERFADLSAAERGEVTAMSEIVYPAELWHDWPGYQIEWATAEWCIRTRGDDRLLTCYVGISRRAATLDGRPVVIGGVSNVKTHPAVRRRGLATQAIQRAVDFLNDDRGVDFSLLVADPSKMPFYARLGWQAFEGELWTRQRGERVAFTLLRTLTLDGKEPGPIAGSIDLCGPPW